MTRTTLVIPTLDRPGDLARCLESIAALRRGFDEILVVDQGDVAATRRVAGAHPGLNVAIHPFAVRSAAQARNAAIEAATGEIIFFIDDDTTLDERYVEVAVEYFERHPRVVALTGNIDEARVRSRAWRLLKRLAGLALLVAPLHPGILRSGGAAPPVFRAPLPWRPEVKFLPGGHCACRRAVFDAGFRFNPRYIRGSFGEDAMFSWQVHRHYGRGAFAYLPEFSLRHYASPERSLGRAAAIRMRVVHRSLFWRREVWGGSRLNAACYLYSQIGFVLFVFKRYRRTPLVTLRALAESYRYLLAHHREIAGGRIDFNRFVIGGLGEAGAGAGGGEAAGRQGHSTLRREIGHRQGGGQEGDVLPTPSGRGRG